MRKAWNLPDAPVYSLVTHGEAGFNMNICTYVIPISRKPKLYAIAIYHQTLTLINALQSDMVLLQLLPTQHYSLVKKLGQTSGLQYHKLQYLLKKKLIEEWENFPTIKGCSALVLLKKVSVQTAGDHDLFIFEMLKHKSVHDQYLRLSTLREKKLIRG